MGNDTRSGATSAAEPDEAGIDTVALAAGGRGAAGRGAGGRGAVWRGAVDPTVQRVRASRRHVHDAGMATAEYAIATLAAVGFAGVLVVVLKGNEVKSLLTGIVRQALGG